MARGHDDRELDSAGLLLNRMTVILHPLDYQRWMAPVNRVQLPVDAFANRSSSGDPVWQ
jgi:hypothetical protein